MSKTKTDKELEQERERLNQEQQRLAEEIERNTLASQQAEENARKHLTSDEEEASIPQPVEVGAKPIKQDEDWSKIVDAYKKEFKKEPENGTLVFPDEASMNQFFTAQAQQGNKFFCILVGPDGKPTNHFEFSCGDGTRYSGNLTEIKEKLMKSLETASPANQGKIQEGLEKIAAYLQATKPNPTQTARQALKDLTQPAEQQSTYKTPSPLSTENIPK